MDGLNYQASQLTFSGVALSGIVAQFSTPCYVYSKVLIEQYWQTLQYHLKPLNTRIFYAVKANSNLSILRLLAQLGAGFDIVSQGELERVLHVGGNPSLTLFSGIGKSAAEIARALAVGIHCINVESPAEIFRVNEIAHALGKKAPIALRINPNIDAHTHPYITTGLKCNKFGIAASEAQALYQKAAQLPGIAIKGIAFHLGSQILTLNPLEEALAQITQLVDDLSAQGIALEFIDVGGGLPVQYHEEELPDLNDYAHLLQSMLRGCPQTIYVEPGRFLTANAGLLLTRVEYLKTTPEHNFAIIDAGMTDLIRPALYQAYHPILPLVQRDPTQAVPYDIVGPVCESADFLGKQRLLNIQANDYLAIGGVGSYGFSMSSNYNSRPRACEVLLAGDDVRLIRQRENFQDLFAGEI